MGFLLAIRTAAPNISLGQFILLCGVAVAGILLGWRSWQVKRQQRAEEWPETEATIQSGGIEVVSSGNRSEIELPVCAFSYNVNGEYYSGRFSLVPSSKPEEFPVRNLVDRKLPLRFDPERPENWYIPLDKFESCVLEQKLRPHIIRLYPKD